MNSCINYMSKLFSQLFQKARITACCFELLWHFFFLLKCPTKQIKNPQIELMFCINGLHKAMYQNMQRSFLFLLLDFLFGDSLVILNFFNLFSLSLLSTRRYIPISSRQASRYYRSVSQNMHLSQGKNLRQNEVQKSWQSFLSCIWVLLLSQVAVLLVSHFIYSDILGPDGAGPGSHMWQPS